MKRQKIAMITGATAGIGKATAARFASEGYDLILCGRRKNILDKEQEELRNSYQVDVFTLAFDVRDRKEVIKSTSMLKDEWQEIDVLVNNAGLALGLASIQDGDPDDWDIMIDTNFKGLLYVSKEIMPLMIKRNRGHIINIGSLAGKEVYAKGNIYCATKFAVDAISRAMRIDLLPHNIRVTAIHPGAVETEFSMVRYKGDEDRAKNVYKGFTPLTPGDIADVIWFTASRPAHVTINDLVITPTVQANTTTLLKKD